MVRGFRSVTTAALISLFFLALPFSPAFSQVTSPGHEYTGANRIVSLIVPKAPNWAGVPYKITALDTKGDKQYDKFMLHADDFGQYLVVGVRVMPAPAVLEMDKDEPRSVLKNISQATLLGWRTDLPAIPEISQESLLDTKYGEAVITVYHAPKGSILVKAQGRRPTRDDAFDTNIASVVARKGAIVIFVLAENDTSPNDAEAVVRMATDLFQDLKVLAAQ